MPDLRPWIGVVAAIAAFLPSAALHAQSTPFAGKTIKLIVGMPPGGGVDSYARLVQRHLARFLPGAPTIIVQNMPGAGSLRSVLALANSPDDAIGTFSSSLITEAISQPERVKVDFRGFAFIGNVSEDVRVCYLRSALGARTWTDLMARDQVVFGATAAGTSGNVDTALLRHLLGVKLRQVQGYAGSADKKLALEKGEIDGDCGGFTSLPQDWLRNGRINIVVRLSPTLLPDLDAGVPFGGDLLREPRDRATYDFLTAPERLGRLFMVPGQSNTARVAALRSGFDAMVRDGSFLAEAEKSGLTVTPMSGAEVDRRIAEFYATPPDVLARARTIAGE
jgi:tripartite-type tricarboxylate transporter receptor subunit TctC